MRVAERAKGEDEEEEEVVVDLVKENGGGVRGLTGVKYQWFMDEVKNG